jgi:D-aminopeptidase
MGRAIGWAILSCLVPIAAASGQEPATRLPVQTREAPPGWAWRSVTPAAGALRMLIIYDMEGLSGIDRLGMTKCSDSAAYAAGQNRLVADVNAVVEGLAAAGVASIDVIDRHGSGCEPALDLPRRLLDTRARELDEKARPLFDRITRHEWDAVALVGAHASPGHNGFLEHIGSFGIERILNGVSVSESEQQALNFGGEGIPVIFASGDDRYVAQMRDRMPWINVVEVKRATSRTSAELRPATDVRAELIAQAKVAVARRNSAKTPALVPPLTGAYRPVWPNSLQLLTAIPGLDVSSGEIRVSASTPRGLNEAINRVATLINSIQTADAYWEAVKDDDTRDRFRDSLFMARWSAGPTLRKPPLPPTALESTFAQATVCDNAHYASEVLLRIDIDDAAPLDLKSDGLGSYSDGAIACVLARQRFTGMPLLGLPAQTTHGCGETKPARSFDFDLSHPVDNAPARGVHRVVAGNLVFIPSIGPTGYVGHTDLVIGVTTPLQLFEIKDRSNDDRLAFAPRWVKGCNPLNVPGPLAGTTEAQIRRTSITTWDIVLPRGSIGRLYRLDEKGDLIDKGLYVFQAHLTVTSR